MKRRVPRTLGKVTLKDVAKLAGVDPSIISRVMNNDPAFSVRDSTRKRILGAIGELGYQPNAMGRGLRTSRAGAYGLIIPAFDNPVYASIISGAERAAARYRSVLLTASTAGGQDSNFAGHAAVLRQGRVDGVLLAGAQHGIRHGDLEQVDVPVIFLNRRSPGSRRFIILDDIGAAAIAVQHLVELGHRRIAHIAGPSTADTATRRRQGYLRAMREADLETSDELVVESDYTSNAGVSAAEQLMRLRRRPSAVFVANAVSAIGAIHAFRRGGLDVPAEMSVVTVHDLPFAAHLEPPLTTVRMPLEKLGERGIELLHDLPESAAIEEVVTDSMELIVRESTAPPMNQRRIPAAV